MVMTETVSTILDPRVCREFRRMCTRRLEASWFAYQRLRGSELVPTSWQKEARLCLILRITPLERSREHNVKPLGYLPTAAEPISPSQNTSLSAPNIAASYTALPISVCLL